MFSNGFRPNFPKNEKYKSLATFSSSLTAKINSISSAVRSAVESNAGVTPARANVVAPSLLTSIISAGAPEINNSDAFGPVSFVQEARVSDIAQIASNVLRVVVFMTSSISFLIL